MGSVVATVEEAIDVLRQLGLPDLQLNERSGLVLLALLDLSPAKAWTQASSPLRGITPMMDSMAENYGKIYAPNSRETVRRQSVHQFVAAGLALQNPDKPDRPVNSGKTVYQINSIVLTLLRIYGTKAWPQNLRRYLADIEPLKEIWAKERDGHRIPVVLPNGIEVNLSPGGQNVLIAQLLNDFCPFWTPGGNVLYVGDADKKFAIFDEGAMLTLGVTIQEHGKMPDLVVYHVQRDWLLLVEAVTSHGPVDAKRHSELQTVFGSSTAGLVFVTAFPDRKAFARYSSAISWETEVWIADAPSHLIHFNGDRYLGPHTV
jgi:BsuBI/PstI restriction endonuclease domain/BsuBI/PstI restriction endonuclease HTH domain